MVFLSAGSCPEAHIRIVLPNVTSSVPGIGVWKRISFVWHAPFFIINRKKRDHLARQALDTHTKDFSERIEQRVANKKDVAIGFSCFRACRACGQRNAGIRPAEA